MSVPLTCPNCGRKAKLPQTAAGTQVKCPVCGFVARVGVQSATGAPPSKPGLTKNAAAPKRLRREGRRKTAILLAAIGVATTLILVVATIVAFRFVSGGRGPNPDTPITIGNAESIYKHTLKSVVCIRTSGILGKAIGSGGLVQREYGLVLTNHHVVRDARQIDVVFPDYETTGDLITDPKHYEANLRNFAIKAKLIASDSRRDLALLKLDRVPDEAISLGIAEKSAVPGQRVFSIGASVRLWPS